MARYLLVRLEDNDDAQKFIDSIKQGHAWRAEPTAEEGTFQVVDVGPMKVMGLFAAPTKFCTCVPRTDKSGRSQNYGWHVCLICKKPKPGNIQHPYNLLDERSNTDLLRRIYVGITEPHPSLKE